ncbi:MAG: RDD family protein [Spartobacteria bacterium]|nr:RDD family protein [Spartobacteria bacterium]
MEWYYVDAGERQGPVSEEAFAELAATGRITAETLVWHEGMTEWQPYNTVAPGATAHAIPQPMEGEATCCECGRVFPRLDMIQYEHSWVCAACKPVFFQRVLEGAPISGEMRYAGFWIRFGAKFVDGILLGLVNMLLSFVAGMTMMASATSNGGENLILLQQVILWVVQTSIGLGYYVFFLGRFGATPGKMAMRIKVVRADGSPISYGRAFGRFFAEWLSAIILYIGYIMVAFDDEKRALHDRICDTRVIRIN